MRSLVIRALAILQLVRMPLALAVGSDLWLATLLVRWNPMAADRAASRMDLWLALAIGGLIGGGLLGFAAGMNDLLDLRRDQATNPGRPLPAGRMRTPHAALVTFGSLVTALLASVAFGDDSLHVALLAAAGIVAWNTVGRHIPWLGIPMMGLAHAGVMFIPWPGQPFTLPACLVFTQAVVTGTLLHQRSGKRPAIDQRTVVGLVLKQVLQQVRGRIGLRAALGARHVHRAVQRGGVGGVQPGDEPLVADALALGQFGQLLGVDKRGPGGSAVGLAVQHAHVVLVDAQDVVQRGHQRGKEAGARRVQLGAVQRRHGRVQAKVGQPVGVRLDAQQLQGLHRVSLGARVWPPPPPRARPRPSRP